VGTFLSVGLKVPYLIWFGKNRCQATTWERAGEPPWNMQAAMIITSVLCIFIGCYAPYLYSLLPHAVRFRPYTSYHVMETLQLLLFTGLLFFLLRKKLKPEPTLSLDLDWFYRKGAQLCYRLASQPVQRLDTWVGELYHAAGLKGLLQSARSVGWFDNCVIDRLVDGLALAVSKLGHWLRQVQRGQLQESLTLAFAVAAGFLLALIFLC
jgi:multicomponent Na+:H+ antiporter subunit D